MRTGVRKWLLVAVGWIATAAGTELCAQSRVSWGVRGEANLSGFLIPYSDAVTSSMRPGATLGGFVRFDLPENFFLQGELLFHYKWSEVQIQHTPHRYQYGGEEISFYAGYQWRMASQQWFAGFGLVGEFGYCAWLTNDRVRIDLYRKKGPSALSAMKNKGSALGAMFGVEFACGLQVQVGYRFDVVNILDANRTLMTMLPHAVSLGVGYRFGVKQRAAAE